MWPTWISEVGSSAAYFENWTLANNAVDYLAADNAASPTQHFWSLSVEEQFYFSLPILIWLLVVALRSRAAEKVSKAVIVLLSVIVVSSLIAGIYLTYAEPVSSYFFTQVRAWQFGAGALLASVWVYVPQNKKFKLLSLIVGLALIVASALLLDGAMAYPGFWAIIPTLGAVLAIASDLEDGPIARLLAWRPIQFVGDVSYSIYLWHWPLIILLPLVIGNLTTVAKISIIIISLGLAALSQKYIEQPFINFGRREGARNRTAIAGMAVARLGRISGGQADAIAVGFQRSEQRFALNHRGAAVLVTVGVGQRAAYGHFEIATGIAGGQGPQFALLAVQMQPGLELTGTAIGQSGIVGNHRTSGLGGRHRGEQNEK